MPLSSTIHSYTCIHTLIHPLIQNTFEVMYINQYGCDAYPDIYQSQPELCTNPQAYNWLAVAYFVAFVIIGGQILLTLFIGRG